MLLRLDPATEVPGSVTLSEALDATVTLRISGSKPMHFQAELLAECSSWSAGTPAWHEVLLYRRVKTGDFAVGVKTCRASMGGNEVFHARTFADLDAALAWLQAFNPTADLGADIDASDRRISTTEIALRAATLRQQADRVEQQYRGMIGELLYRMDAGE
jgi:hypothetical protein